MIGMLSAFPGLAQLRLPIVTSYHGGDSLVVEVRVPLATLQNAAGVLRPFVGMGALPRGP
jgi:hypothetical protein